MPRKTKATTITACIVLGIIFFFVGVIGAPLLTISVVLCTLLSLFIYALWWKIYEELG